MMTPDELWYGMLNEVKKKIPSTMYSTWIESSLILVSYENDIVTIDTAKSFIRAFIKKKIQCPSRRSRFQGDWTTY